MGLALDAIEPVVYPVARDLFETIMQRHWVAAYIFKQFGERFHIPESEVNTAMIDLCITYAEKDFKNSKRNAVEKKE
ncbi:hypothetical protein AGMMS4956_04360 [Bacteroidia bacterium]|nr:hypothetical protein AGMMS4956_04360 [Bacteroidia bacterium]